MVVVIVNGGDQRVKEWTSTTRVSRDRVKMELGRESGSGRLRRVANSLLIRIRRRKGEGKSGRRKGEDGK